LSRCVPDTDYIQNEVFADHAAKYDLRIRKRFHGERILANDNIQGTPRRAPWHQQPSRVPDLLSGGRPRAAALKRGQTANFESPQSLPRSYRWIERPWSKRKTWRPSSHRVPSCLGTELLSACRDSSTRSARSTPTRGFPEVYERLLTPRKRKVSGGVADEKVDRGEHRWTHLDKF